ncbi:MAG: HGxxPAAW family protein [Candidatus Nanopelagicales bacterium]
MSTGNHGSTPAAWTLVVLVTLGFIVSTVALVIGQWPAFWAGVAIVAVGAVVSGIMKAAGLGKKTQHAS